MTDFRVPLAFGAANGAAARSAVSSALRSWKVADPDCDALIVTTELVDNVHRHTADGGELRLALTPDALLIEVFDTSPELPTLRDPEPAALGGRGLRLVEALARCWGARALPSGGKVVWAELAVPQQH
jgi:anti-sigma regulatory factor (Ser/Thr protein kinase)